MAHFENIHRVVENETADAVSGKVVWSPLKSIFLLCAYALTAIAVIYYFTWDAFALFAIKTSAVLLLGHSVGMHRRLIHNSFDCPLWLEYFLVYIGVLVGLGGPSLLTSSVLRVAFRAALSGARVLLLILTPVLSTLLLETTTNFLKSLIVAIKLHLKPTGKLSAIRFMAKRIGSNLSSL